MKSNKLILLLLYSFICLNAGATNHKLFSPNKNISVEIQLKEKIYYTVFFKDERVLDASPLSLAIDKGVLGTNPTVINAKETSVDKKLATIWGQPQGDQRPLQSGGFRFRRELFS